MNKISECCGAEPIGVSEDIGICPECKDHCEYLTEEEAYGPEPVCDHCDGTKSVSVGDGPFQEDRPCPDCTWQPDPDAKHDHENAMRF